MNAIIVSADFSDYLSQTLRHNRPHFDHVVVVTNCHDEKTEEIARANDCDLFNTDAFTESGAYFNKGLGLERALDCYGRHGWMASMDADIILPQSGIPELTSGYLYGPRRRIWRSDNWNGTWDWSHLPLFPDNEWAGYCQIFDGDDPVLTTLPWFETDWCNGCCDSGFQARWPEDRKKRPDFEVLHIGRPGRFWFGRSEEARKAQRRLLPMRSPKCGFSNEKIRR